MVVTNKQKFLKEHGFPEGTSFSLEEIADLSDIPVDALQLVYNRGIGAWKTNPQSVRMKGTFKKGVNAPISMKLSKEQWAAGRVYAFVMKTKKVYYDADNDIRERYGLE